MSRKYSSWASNQPLTNSDLALIKLNTVVGNEQDQLKHIERVEAIPHMYINIDAPPPPTPRIDARAMPPAMISRQNSSYLAAPATFPPTNNGQTKIWPVAKPTKMPSSFENASSTSKRHHKHKHHHHHHHHHGDKQHHHHHSRKHRAKSAESIRNRQHQSVVSPSKMIVNNPQYIEQDQQQQQPMIVYREVPNGEGYTVDSNGVATVPYGLENENAFVDDQQAPMIVYREQAQPQYQQQQQSIMTDGLSQQVFFNPEQETTIGSRNVPLQSIENKLISQRGAPINETQVGNYSPMICTRSLCPPVTTGYIQEIERIYLEEDCCVPAVNCVSQTCVFQQSDPFAYHPQQQSSQIVYCTDPNHQDYLCAASNQNIIQQSISSPVQQHQQQQYLCMDNTPTTIQPTIINQIPVFNPLSANNTTQPVVNLSQASLQHAASAVFQQPQPQPFQIIQQPQQLQVLQQQQPQQFQVLQQQQQPQQLQILQQQPQQLQVIQQPQAGQFVQFAPAAGVPQVLQTIQPQVIQAQPFLQTIQMPNQAVAASPQILYQRPYDPVVVPIQNQQMAIAQSPLVALSQPSYAPSRIVSGAPGPNMFRHALLRTVADRTGVPVPGTSAAGLQLVQPVAGLSSPNLLIAGGVQQSGSLPIVPLTPGGLLIPFQPAQPSGVRPGPLPRAGGYPSTLRNFDDIRRQMQNRRVQLLQNLQQQNYSRIPSPPVLSAAARNPSAPYSSGNIFPFGARSGPPPSLGRPYTQPSLAGSVTSSVISAPYNPLRA